MSSGEPMTDHTAGQREPSAPSRGSVAKHDAVPAATAVSEQDRTDKAATCHRHDGTGDTHSDDEGRSPFANRESDRPKPIKSARLQALEQLSAMDQELEIQYGLTGNPMIKAQEHTPQSQPTPGEGRSQGECTEPVAWLVEGCEYDTGCEFQYVALLKEQADAAAAEGATVTPLSVSQQSRLWIAAAEYTGGISSAGESKPTLTPEEREAVEIAVEYVGSAYQVEHHAAVLRGLLERTR